MVVNVKWSRRKDDRKKKLAGAMYRVKTSKMYKETEGIINAEERHHSFS